MKRVDIYGLGKINEVVKKKFIYSLKGNENLTQLKFKNGVEK